MLSEIRVKVTNSKPIIEYHNHCGRGSEWILVYPLPCLDPLYYWKSVTDISCPKCRMGVIRWYEAGYVPGYRICDDCRSHFLAQGNAARPELHLMPKR